MELLARGVNWEHLRVLKLYGTVCSSDNHDQFWLTSFAAGNCGAGNPMGTAGAKHLADALASSQQLQVLNLNGTTAASWMWAVRH